jgi:hypothetical protein
MKQTAVEWLVDELILEGFNVPKVFYDKAKAMEKEQSGYSEEDVIKIVEKSRETGLTAEFLLLTYKKQEQ